MDLMNNNLWRVKVGLAEMLKGGVIMDVTNAEQAKIAEDAGACAVMALERVPSDIRKEGGVARMAAPRIIREIMDTVSIPVMAKVRIGHFAEAQVLEALEVDYIDESEVLTPARSCAERAIWAKRSVASPKAPPWFAPRAKPARAISSKRSGTCARSSAR
jgi:pyridoxal 5'-phosphate synthase pdxS subunit